MKKKFVQGMTLGVGESVEIPVVFSSGIECPKTIAEHLYDNGWIDGWNACHNEHPDKRDFMTEEKMNKRYPKVKK